MRKFVNLTPHQIVLIGENGVLATFPSAGVARVQQSEILLESEPVPLVKVEYGEVQGLPAVPENDTIYIVSSFVANALKASDSWQEWQGHIAIPNSGPTQWGAIRDEQGRIKGVRSLIIF